MSGTRIWPPSKGPDDMAYIWDDSELIADCEAADAQFKQKVREVWCNREGSKKAHQRTKKGRNNRPIDRLKYDPKSETKDWEVQETTDEQKTDASPIPFTQSTLETADQSCDFRYLPPLTNLPEFLFNSLTEPDQEITSRLRTLGLNLQPDNTLDPQSAPAQSLGHMSNSFEDWESVLHAWYQAGYSLGRAHGLKMRSKMELK